ncbi:PEP-CTERM sorting domain-containing protein [Halochromatium salexigens]|nr:PEP-CTERM sorting domain-containing protein [Halochromatium salexigens]
MPDTREVRLTRLVAAALLPAALLFAGPASAALITYDFSIDDGGFTANGTTGAALPWTWNATDGRWEVPQSPGAPGSASGQSWLAAPAVIAGGSTLTLSFEHEYDFDWEVSGLADYGQLLVSINGGPNQRAGVDLGTFTTGSRGYTDPWFLPDPDQYAWSNKFGPGTSTVLFTGLTAGDELAFNWVANWDNFDVDGDPAWSITAAEIAGVAPAAPAPIPEPATLTLLGLGLAGLTLGARRRWSHR